MRKFKPAIHNIENERFGYLRALHITEERDNGFAVWVFRCDCRNLVKKRAAYIVYLKNKGQIISCGPNCITKSFKYIGKKSGKLKIKSIIRHDKKEYLYCQCECGNYTFITRSALFLSKTVSSCGCYKKEIGAKNLLANRYKRTPYFRDLSKEGKIYRLTPIRPTDRRIGDSIVWECLCDCGNITYKSSMCLTNKNRPVKSCGCLRKGRKKNQSAL